MLYNDVLQGYINALMNQIRFLKEIGGKRYNIFAGEKVAAEKEGHMYSFECDNELHLGDSFPVRIEYKGRKYQGEIISIEGFTIWIATSMDLGDKVDLAYLTCEPWNLLESLITRLKECQNGERVGLSHILVEEGPLLYEQGNTNKIQNGQDIARRHVKEQPITAVWGPPGTGKTYTLSKIALDCCKQKQKVLIVSQSNVSVDGAVNKILNILGNGKNESFIRNGMILRYGFVKDKSLSNHPTATAYNFVLNNVPQLKEKKEQIDQKFAEYRGNGKAKDENLDDIREKRKNIVLRIKEFEKQAVKRAKIVATTASKIAVEKLFYEEGDFDVVIFDEASMAYIPQIIYASSLAKAKLIILGDFKQLAPIAQGDDVKSLLAKDIYSFLNISDEYGNINFHPWLVMLNEQRRMHPKIADFVSKHVYKGKISSEIMKSNAEIATLTLNSPFSNESMILFNLAGTYNVAMKNAERSRFNVMSAVISVLIAVDSAKNGINVGIITPYSAQARLIKAMLNDIEYKNIECSTVHQFQGSERDVIILDTVESYPGARAGMLLTSEENNNVERLVNVAVTRARGKFITVSNWAYWNNLMYGKKSILMDLFQYQRYNGREIEERELPTYLMGVEMKGINIYTKHSDASTQLELDLKNAKHEVSIVFPKGTVIDSNWITIISDLEQYGVTVLVKAPSKIGLPEKLRDKVVISENAIIPVILIDGKISWYGIPGVKFDFVVHKTTLKTRHWMAFRIKGEKTTDQISSFAEVKSVIEGEEKQKIEVVEKLKSSGLKSYIEEKYKCIECNSALTLKKGKKYYCRCSKCKHTEFLTTDMVNSFVLNNKYVCPQHGSMVKAKLSKYGVYAWCMSGHVIDVGDM